MHLFLSAAGGGGRRKYTVKKLSLALQVRLERGHHFLSVWNGPLGNGKFVFCPVSFNTRLHREHFIAFPSTTLSGEKQSMSKSPICDGNDNNLVDKRE